MIDLHVHYAMHVSPPEPIWSALRIWSKRGRASFMDRWDAVLLAGFNRLLNYESARSGPRVTIDGMRRGGLDVALSVLCTPFLEIGNHATQWYSRKPPYATPPEDRYLDVLMRQLSAVESRLAQRHHEQGADRT